MNQIITREAHTDIAGATTQHIAPANPMIAMIERIVLSPDASIEKLKEMIALKHQEEDREIQRQKAVQKRSYFAAMAECQAKIPVVTKNQSNDHTRSKYADLAAIEQQAMPIIHNHGFTASFHPDGYGEAGELRVQWMVAHRDGHSESGVVEMPMDSAGAKGNTNKTGVQAFGSTATYARRYLLCMLFNISTGDDNDGNRQAERVETITADQFQELRQLIEKSSMDVAGFILAFGGNEKSTLEEFPSEKFAEAKARLAKNITAKDARNG